MENKEKKKSIIDNAIATLKKEFVGIDEQIDEIMNIVRVWYVYPELQNRPCVVNLYGMSGCGKTSLVRRIAQLLDKEEDYHYYNFADINEKTSRGIEDEIKESCKGYQGTTPIFVYDEFQYAATLDESGCEKDNKNALKPFWELLDTGKLKSNITFWDVERIESMRRCLESLHRQHPLDIQNGNWLNAQECMIYADDYLKEEIRYFYNCSDDNFNKFLLTSSGLVRLREFCNITLGEQLADYDLIKMVSQFDADKYMEFLSTLTKRAKKGVEYDYHQSIIFVIANLDEAYTVAFDVNPDMSADQFHKITKQISIVDIKQALQKRFRNEQIARLGNTHVIYPAFTSNSYKAIIKMELDNFTEKAESLTGKKFSYDDKLVKFIYDEAVYPTHGTRPIFSTINEIIKAKLPVIIDRAYTEGIFDKVEYIKYTVNRNSIVVKVLSIDNEEITIYRFQDKLRLKELRVNDQSESQANAAVHESGHFVVYSYLFNKIPEKVVSKSTDKRYGGFMMPTINNDDVLSRERLLNDIKVSLGGYVAEKLVFGFDHMSNGSSSDIATATETAGKMIRQYGLHGKVMKSTTLVTSLTEYFAITDDNAEINLAIAEILNNAIKETEEIIKTPQVWNALVKSSRYLAQHPMITKREMSNIVEEMWTDGGVKTPYSYKKCVEELKEK